MVGSEAEPSAGPIYFAILRCPPKGASALELGFSDRRLVPVQFTSPYFVLCRRRSVILNMPRGMLTVGETTLPRPPYAPVGSSLAFREARDVELRGIGGG